MKKAIFITVYMFAVGLGFIDFIYQFTLRLADPEQGSIWYLTLGTLAFLAAFSVCGCLSVSRRTSEMVGWGVVVLVAIMGILLGVQKAGGETTAKLGTAQIVLFVLFGLVALLGAMGKSPKSESAHGH